MNKTKKILVFVVLIPLVVFLKLYFFPASEIFKRTYKYSVKNERGNTVDCKIYESHKEGFIVIMFPNNNRLYVFFKEKRLGLALYEHDSYKLTEDYLYLFKGNLFYRDGISHKRLSLEMNDAIIYFNGSSVETTTKSLYLDCEKIIIEKKDTF